MYAIVWSETRRVAEMEGLGKRLVMTVLTVLTVGLRVLWASVQFIATKPGKEAQTGPAEYLATSAVMSCRQGRY